MAAEREAVQRREEAERQKIALDASEAEKNRRTAEESRLRQEQINAAELQKVAAAREAAQRLEEAELQKAALKAQEAERARKIAEERGQEERARNLAEAARRLAEEETARLARATREAEEREQARLAARASNSPNPPASLPPTAGDQPPYQVAAVTPTGSPGQRKCWEPDVAQSRHRCSAGACSPGVFLRKCYRSAGRGHQKGPGEVPEKFRPDRTHRGNRCGPRGSSPPS